jgi:hypothetical protein
VASHFYRIWIDVALEQDARDRSNYFVVRLPEHLMGPVAQRLNENGVAVAASAVMGPQRTDIKIQLIFKSHAH